MTAKTSAPTTTPDADLIHLVETAQRALAEGDLCKQRSHNAGEDEGKQADPHQGCGRPDLGSTEARVALHSFDQ